MRTTASCHVANADTKALVLPSDDEIVALADEVDVFRCSRSRYGQVARLDLGKPVIELRFHMSRQSAARVIEALARPRVPGAHQPTGAHQLADAAGQTSPS